MRWPTTKLRYVADLNPGVRADLLGAQDTEVSFLPMESIGEDGSLNLDRTRPVAEVRNGYSYFEDGDVAFAKVTPCFENGKGALMHGLERGAGFGTSELTVLRLKGEGDARFLNYVVQSEQFRRNGAGAMTGAGGLKRVPDDFTRDFRTPWPASSVQERIANFLDAQTARIDALIAEKRLLRQALEQQRFSTQYELVTRGLRSSKVRPTHVTWLETVPVGWDVARIKHVAKLESGHTPDKKVDAYWQNCDIPWVSLNDTGQLLLVDYIQETASNISELGIQNSSARLLPKGTVFFSRDATIGRCGIAARPMACSQHFIGWVCGPRVLPEYLLYVLRSMAGELERLSMGATLKTIGMDDVRTLSMPLPSLVEQRDIVSAVRTALENIDSLSATARQLEERLIEYRSSLISSGVTGQLDFGAFKEAA